jgi:CubicO group peptidase (beta-lactamase class C family)
MSKNIDELEKLLQSHYRRSKNSMMAIGIQKGDTVKEYFYNDSSNPDQSLFGLGSISKTIIGTYINVLVNRGKLDINKTIDTYLDGNPKINYPTLLEIATHTSGYHAFIPLWSSLKILITKGFNKVNIYKNLNRDWFVKSYKRIRPLKRKKYRYSDYNYAILALLIEHIEQRPYTEVIIDFLHREIGMTETTYGNYALTKNDSFSWLWNDDNPFIASGGLFSTVQDMLLFLNYQISQKDVLSLSHNKHHKTNLNKNIFTSFSWNSFYNGSFYWHIGGQGCYRSYALFDTKRHISLVILCTVDINLQHISRLGSSLYRNIKRNHNLALDYLESMNTHTMAKEVPL